MWSVVMWSKLAWFMWKYFILNWREVKWATMNIRDKSDVYIRVTLFWGYCIVLCLFHSVCILYCDCFNLLCNVWVCVCVGFVISGCFVNQLNTKLNPIFQFLTLLGAHPPLHVSRIRVNMCNFIYTLLHCLYCVSVLFRLGIFILICLSVLV
jgi:hypothetical protein